MRANVARALIAEDEPLLAEALAAELRRAWPDLVIATRVGDGASALRETLAQRPDICFLDIRMPGLSGLEAAAALVEEWPAEASATFPQIVFVTAYDEYAVQAFAVQAVDYLVKPVTADRLAACVARLRQRLLARPQRASPSSPSPPAGDAAPAGGTAEDPGPALQRTLAQLQALLPMLASAAPAPGAAPQARLEVIQAQVGSTVHLVPIDEVIYFEAADKYVRVVTAHRDHLIRTALKELLPQLDPQRFWQVHRGTVVQARCITTARREESGKVLLELQGRPETVTVSRLYAHLFKGM
jgi:DNA-binding LytR/AlgR family response regulator